MWRDRLKTINIDYLGAGGIGGGKDEGKDITFFFIQLYIIWYRAYALFLIKHQKVLKSSCV